jgi:hypothetical protein
VIIQTNPEMFKASLPVYKVSHIDKGANLVTLSGSDGLTKQVRLDSWGTLEETQPLIGSKVQLLD